MRLTKKLVAALLATLMLATSAFSATVFAEIELTHAYTGTVYEAVGTYAAADTTDTAAEDISVFGFLPDAVGLYLVTTDTAGATLYSFTGSEFFLVNGGAAEENTVVIEVKEGYVGNTYFFGVGGVDSANVTIAIDEDGELSTDPADLPWETYENPVTPVEFTLELGEGESLSYVNYRESHGAMLGEDGYYHLDRPDGELLYINIGLNAPAPIKLMEAVSYGQVRSYIYDDDGNFVKKIDFNNAISEYNDCADDGVYPLTYDHIYIMQTYGNSQGWYEQGATTCIFGDTAEFNEDSAWMFLCCYVPAADSDENSDSDVSEEPYESADQDVSDEPIESDTQNESSDGTDEMQEYVAGDVNHDNTINSLDAAAILKYDAMIIDFDEATLYLANVNGDGTVDTLDAAKILKLDAGLIDSLDEEDEEEAFGTEENPYIVFSDGDFFVNPGETVYFSITYKNGLVLTATAGDFSDERLIVDLNEAYSFTNESEETVTLSLEFNAPAGHLDNPIELTLGENVIEIEEGTEGLYYSWTATADGTLTIAMPEDEDWFYCINNMTNYMYGDNQWSDSDPVVATATVEVAEGDVIQLIINSYDPANMWVAPAATLTVTVSFE